MKEILNCTPHDVVIVLGNGIKVSIPSSKYVVRIEMGPVRDDGRAEIVPGLSVPLVAFSSRVVTGEVLGLPPMSPDGEYPPLLVGAFGTGLIAAKWPGEVYVVDTSPDSVVRDASGRIIGIRRLCRAVANQPRQ